MHQLQPDSPLIRNMVTKRDQLPGHEAIRLAIIFQSGGMRGVIGAGVAMALQALGFGETADVIIGTSAGTANAAYFLAGLEQVRLGTSIYYQECTSGQFISFAPLHVHIDYLMTVFAAGRKALDQEAIHRSRSEFFVGLTRYQDGSFHLVNAKTAKPNMAAAIHASMAMPFLYDRRIEVNGDWYVDGGQVELLPVDQIMEMFQPTDLLIISNEPPPSGIFATILPTDTIFSLMKRLEGKPEFAHQAFTRQARYLASLQKLRQLGVNYHVIWSSNGLNLLTKKPQQLFAAAAESFRQTVSLFGRPDIEPNLY